MNCLLAMTEVGEGLEQVVETVEGNWGWHHWCYLGVFAIVFAVSLCMDLLMHRGHKAVSMKNALMWSGIWICVSVAFAGVTGLFLGSEKAWLYLSGWVLEKTLAIDNLFAFFAVFSSFGLMTQNNQWIQHRILHWGILGAIAFRAILLAGIGFFLSLPGIANTIVLCVLAVAVAGMAYLMWRKAFSKHEKEEVDYTKHWSVRWTERICRVKADINDGHFFARQDGRLAVAVPFLALICIESVDIGFSFDSMPAIAAVVRDPIIMLTATMMAVAGLRALYFALLGASNKLCHLEKAVALLLAYIALKLGGEAFHFFHIPNWVNFGVVLAFIAAGVAASFIWPRKKEQGNAVTSEPETDAEVEEVAAA